MDEQNFLQDEIDQKLEEILAKVEQILEPHEISLIRWACGKSSTTSHEAKNVSIG